MSFSKILAFMAVALFSLVLIVGLFKKAFIGEKNSPITDINDPIELQLDGEYISTTTATTPFNEDIVSRPPPVADESSDVDRINELFNLGMPKLPIVETVTYTSRVPWKRGAAAWVVDYANHYKTSRHFIARSLNKKVDYDTQNVTNGDKFNVFRKDKDVDFHLVVDITRSKLWFYYHDKSSDERVLLKTYPVGLGRADTMKASGILTPIGKYSLGDKIAVYRPGYKGIYNGERIEMMTVFGTRWIPFDKEISECTEPAKGLGIHGAPWVWNEKTRRKEESLDGIGEYDSDGCIRLRTADIEELFAIVITKPTYIQLVKDFRDADVPGVE
ncbi:MAG: L,D-transpeptidase [Waddliaceae bacterium]|nr:L,D-transpeptidase [Waddliaceae bacterium]MBT3578797.1 L,D-transpeptidase [Waddliaceae bacterium]MBT6928217.1 L,D-transpeptidase [Waddliaceae bacterium]MBT7264196.1 L,D-transpeptidase [Waddliaceae bacterium]